LRRNGHEVEVGFILWFSQDYDSSRLTPSEAVRTITFRERSRRSGPSSTKFERYPTEMGCIRRAVRGKPNDPPCRVLEGGPSDEES
jgi:hypothetical protein